ncbi:immunoglobulin superfamily member [Chiloscyllium plagiosum]|uniref:immunoglobulin superfamily member n=1 Tax=Chiloscyllium plagiosum TaxID=36176 RepID=UPI001CB83CAE|nr:immunoglobulin superfamily member [Chiloscyllium plagiosum]
MMSNAKFLLILLTLLDLTTADAPDSSVSIRQSPPKAVISKGSDIILYCILPLSHDNSEFEVRWWKRGENKFLQPGVDKRKHIGVISKGSANLDLRNAMLQDSGIYHCTVIRQGAFYGNGTGTNLTVCISPAPIKIYTKPRKDNSSKSLTLVCQTSAFHPGDFTLVWYKNGTAISPAIIKKQNAEGLYQAFSSLEEAQPERTEVVYICLVIHISLRTPAIAIHTVTNTYSGMRPTDLKVSSTICKI